MKGLRKGMQATRTLAFMFARVANTVVRYSNGLSGEERAEVRKTRRSTTRGKSLKIDFVRFRSLLGT